MTRIGAVFLPQWSPEQVAGVARAAEDTQLDELWLWEDCFRESGIATASAILAWTSRLHVGIGVMPVPLRNVAIAAMELATIERLFPGRLVAGIGHGVQPWMAQVGAKVASPVTLLREYTSALAALLAGETVTTSGRYVSLDNVALDWPPARRVALHAAAEGPNTLRLAGEVADGTVLPGGFSPTRVQQSRVLIDEGRLSAGRTDPHRLTVYVLCTTGTGATERLRAAQQEWGYDTESKTGVTGDADEVAQALRPWIAAGADTIVLQPGPNEPDPQGFMRFAGNEVAPLLH